MYTDTHKIQMQIELTGTKKLQEPTHNSTNYASKIES